MKKILNIIYPTQTVAELHIKQAPKTNLSHVTYIYDKQNNTFNP